MASEFLASLNGNSNFLITFSLIQKLCQETPNMSSYLRQKQFDFNANRSTRSYFTQKASQDMEQKSNHFPNWNLHKMKLTQCWGVQLRSPMSRRDLKFKELYQSWNRGPNFETHSFFFSFFWLGNCLCRGQNPRAGDHQVNRVPLRPEGPVVRPIHLLRQNVIYQSNMAKLHQ